MTWRYIIPASLLLSTLTGGTVRCEGLEFTADLIMRVEQRVERTRVVYREDMWRMEHNTFGPVQVTIVRKDRLLAWHLLPATRQFKTVRFTRNHRLTVRPALEGELTRKIIGTQVMDGHPAVLYEVTTKTAGGVVKHFYQWIATDVNFPLKLVNKNGDWTMEYRHVRFGPMPDYFFQLPHAYLPVDDTARN
ncbi:MAG: hypothetical protein JSR62_01410 [Nitrospira sp.]|nr:hypothetical protein [Nitrospira sp.]